MEKYKVLITALIISFLENRDKDSLITALEEIESELIEENPDVENGGLWLRFTKDDPMATTIVNIQNDLLFPHMPNHRFRIKSFELVKELNQLEVNFS